ncbi:DUF2627 domain-containing protein [Gorillibacterium sp. sgz5001074]|uniref:DUF2627 domain-containing protein n=1 Tax=Gorillibacterium sp. sgz5001074 TaxID=3446695 RepID=UPI003F663DF1
MRLLLQRLAAALMLVIPGLAATYGFLAMKNAFFHQFEPEGGFQWGRFLLGLLLFAVGSAFIGGWIFFRDRKRGYVAPQFRAKKKRPRPPEP